MGHDPLPDYYEILGVARSATQEEITRAFRRTLRAVHPDASGTSGLFRLVKMAYDTLGDPVARAAYDLWPVPGPAGPPPAPEPDPGPETRSRDEPSPDSAATPGNEARSRPEEHPVGEGAPDEPSFRASHGDTTTPPPWTQQPPPDEPPGTGGGVRVGVRPRFGGYRTQVAGVGVCCAVFMAAVFALWPAGLPAGLFVLLVLPVLSAPVIAAQPVLASRGWPWTACVVPFAATAALAAVQARGLPFRVALSGLVLTGAGPAAIPWLIRRGQELDALVPPGSLTYQIFNVPGAGLADAAARAVPRISAVALEELTALPGVRVVHGLVPPQLPGHARCYVDHAVLRDDRLALVMTRRWPAARYAWTAKGALTADGQRFPGCDTGIAAAVKAFRAVTPRGVRVRGFVAVLDGEPVPPPGAAGAAAESGGLMAGSLPQVSASVSAWLAEADPVVHRRLFTALLPHIRRPEHGD